MDKKIGKSFNIGLTLIQIGITLAMAHQLYALFITKKFVDCVILGFIAPAFIICLFAMKHLLKAAFENLEK